MKKTAALVLIALCLLSLCSCGVEAAEVRAYLESQVAQTPYEAEQDMQRALSASSNQGTVKTVANEMLDEFIQADDFQSVMRLTRVLEQAKFQDQDLRRRIMVYMQEVQQAVYEGQKSLAEYAADAQECLYTVETSVPDPGAHTRFYLYQSHLFEYDKLLTCVQTHYASPVFWNPAAGEEPHGGYYASAVNDEAYQYESYWFSPLDNARVNEGFVGTYRVSCQYDFYGDFLLESREKYWYQTEASDPNNEEEYTLYYKGVPILKGSAAQDRLYDLLLQRVTCYELQAGEEPVLLFLNEDDLSPYDNKTSSMTILPAQAEAFVLYQDY